MSGSVMDILGMAQRVGDQARGSLLHPSAVPPRRDPTSDLIAASLAAGMIAAAGKTVTAAEAVGVFREVREALAHRAHCEV